MPREQGTLFRPRRFCRVVVDGRVIRWRPYFVTSSIRIDRRDAWREWREICGPCQAAAR